MGNLEKMAMTQRRRDGQFPYIRGRRTQKHEIARNFDRHSVMRPKYIVVNELR